MQIFFLMQVVFKVGVLHPRTTVVKCLCLHTEFVE